MAIDDKPRFLVAAEEVAREQGTDPEDILRLDWDAESAYPAPACSDEVDKPRFLVAAEEVAREQGTDPEEVLRLDWEAESAYPGPACLLPDEVERFFSDRPALQAERAAHVAACPACAAILANAGADPAELRRLLVLVKASPPPHTGKARRAVLALARWASYLSSAGAVVLWLKRFFASFARADVLHKARPRLRRAVQPKTRTRPIS
jgi:hypothetical protein